MFHYHVPTAIHLGAHESERLPEYLSSLMDGPSVLVVTDPGIEKAGIVQPLLERLQEAGFATTLFTQVAPNPRDTDCLIGAEVFREVSADAVIGIGGGSAMDTAKAIALLGPNGGAPGDYVEGRQAYGHIAPVICVPTTAGTGSEVTRSSVITEASTHRKLTLKHASLRPQIAVLDPLLTLTVPSSVTAATGVDALVHAIEGSTCTLSSPVTRAFGWEAMRRIVPALPRAFADGTDVDARTEMLTGSLLAGLCFGSSDVAAVHCLAEALGGLYDTPHGVANAIFLPEVLRFNADVDIPLHAELGRTMGFATDSDSDAKAVDKLLDGIAHWTTNLEIPRLRDLGYVKEADFDRLVDLAMENNSTPSNVRPITKADYRGILERVWES